MSDKNAEAFNQIALQEIEESNGFYGEDSPLYDGASEAVGSDDSLPDAGDDIDSADDADFGDDVGHLPSIDEIRDTVSYCMKYVLGGNPDAEPAMVLINTRIPMVGELVRFHIDVADVLRINSFIYNQYTDLSGIYRVALVINEHTLADHNDESIHYTIMLEDVTGVYAPSAPTTDDEVQPGESDA